MRNQLFNNGDTFPFIGLGTWLSKPNEVYHAVIEAIIAGYRHFDCASIYGNEKEVGEALQHAFSHGMVKREDLFITSKLWNSDHHPDDVEPALNWTLNDLRLDYIDLYLMHWPIAFKRGIKQAKTADDQLSLNELPIEKTWRAMEKQKTVGKARHIGVSNFNIPKLEKLIQHANVRPEMNQIELHPFFQQEQLVNYCQQQNILITAYCPLGSHHLMSSDDSLINNPTIQSIALKHNCTTAQILLAWGMQRGTTVIPKSVKPHRIKENLESIHIMLDEHDVHLIKTLERKLRIAKGLYAVLPNGHYTYESIWEE